MPDLTISPIDEVLAVDIGNTNTVFGLIDGRPGQREIQHWRTVTQSERTSDELGIFLRGFLQSAGVDPLRIRGFIYSSVVPSFNPIVERMAEDYFAVTALRVDVRLPLPLMIDYPRPDEIGADRLVNAVAADRHYGGDLIVIDLGTATTFCVLHGGSYLGGSIAPGLKMSIEALHRRTAQLPAIQFSRPDGGVIGRSTTEAIQAGFFYGWVGLLREIISEIRRQSPERHYRVIATGGLSALIHKEMPGLFDLVDPMLTLRGLKEIWRNHYQLKGE